MASARGSNIENGLSYKRKHSYALVCFFGTNLVNLYKTKNVKQITSKQIIVINGCSYSGWILTISNCKQKCEDIRNAICLKLMNNRYQLRMPIIVLNKTMASTRKEQNYKTVEKETNIAAYSMNMTAVSSRISCVDNTCISDINQFEIQDVAIEETNQNIFKHHTLSPTRVDLFRTKNNKKTVDSIEENNNIFYVEDTNLSIEMPYDSDDSIKDPNFTLQQESSGSDHTLSPTRVDLFRTKNNKKTVDSIEENNNICYVEDTNLSIEMPYDSDDSIKDSNLTLQQKSSGSDHSFSSTEENNFHDLEQSQVIINDVSNKNVQSVKRKASTKRNFCIYCKTLITKLPRHLEIKHFDETDVKKLNNLPKGSRERKKLLDTIRKNGNFLYNTDENLNRGDVITCRRPQKGRSVKSGHYKTCPECKGFFSILSLRKHYRKCVSNKNNFGERNILVNSRRVRGDIHIKACDILKNEVFPVLREDEITNLLKYDELIILYGNKMCRKYRSKHHHKMIRSRLRLIGRFLNEIKKVNSNITNFSSIFQPIYYDDVLKAINIVAQLDENETKYASPSTAFALGTALKSNAKTFIFELIKIGDHERKQLTEDFLKLMMEDFTISINKTVSENIFENKRQKQITLPSNNDIKHLNNYLATNRAKYYDEINKNGFTYENWKNLASVTLTSIQVFNRRRAGEIERALILDFKNYQSVDENTHPDIFRNLSEISQCAAKRYVRFVIRGKKNRGVPVLLHHQLLDCVNLILKHRKEAGVPDDNPYIFGLPGQGMRHTYLEATNLMRKFSECCGANNPKSLRGTELRKHIATQSVLLNLEENEVQDLANFLGHADKIHREHYRMPILTRDIAQMSRLLEMAQGEDDSSNVNNNNNKRKPRNKENTIAVEPELSSRTSENSPYHTYGQTELSLRTPENSPDQICGEIEPSPSTPENSPIQTCGQTEFTPRTPDESRRKRSREINNGYIPRKSWCTPERSTARSLFQNHINDQRLPSYKECEKCISEHPELSNRTPIQLKLWIQNQITKLRKPGVTTPPKNKRIIQTWITPERKAIRSAFKDCLDNESLPSLQKCRQAKINFPVLQERTPQVIKSYVNNEIRKKRKLLNNN